MNAPSSRRTFTLLAAALLSLTAACNRKVEASTGPGPGGAPPKVTVAIPIVTETTEAGDYVARTEARDRVEIRARVSGPIVRAAFHEGDFVRKGTLLFVIDSRPYEVAVSRARAELATVRADRTLSQRNLERAVKLRQIGAIAENELDEQTSRQAQLVAREQAADAAVAAAQLDLDHAYVRAPIDGKVGRKLITEGNLVGPSTASPLTTMVSIDPLYVYLEVEEARGLALANDETLKVQVGFAGEVGFPREARVDFIDNHVEQGSGTVKLRAVVPNPDGSIKDGISARVRLPLGAARASLLVSDRAVATDQDRRFVWIVSPSGKAEVRPIKLGALHEGLRVVREGLREGDRVVVRGLSRLAPGAMVSPDLIAMGDVELADEKAAK